MNIYGTFDEGSSAVIKSAGELDMGGNKIINVKTPTNTSDCATAGYVVNFTSYLQNNKVDWGGGTMTGELSMGGHKLTNVGDPQAEGDVVNKKYIDGLLDHVHDLDIYALGRYLVFPGQERKQYIPLSPKKNVDLLSGILVEIKNNISNNPNIRTIMDLTLLPNPNKDLDIMRLNTQLAFRFNSQAQPWVVLFSAKPGSSPPRTDNNSEMHFVNPGDYIHIQWTNDSFKYRVNNSNFTALKVDTTKFNHFAFEYVENILTVWLNGASRKKHNIELGDLSHLTMGVKNLGIVSLYERDLTKHEIIEHFMEYHVKNFTNDEIIN